MRKNFRVTAISLIATCAGCGTMDQVETKLMTDPSRYTVYDCSNIESSMSAARVRNDEIEQLMSRAAQGTGGAFVNLVAYRTEYLQNKGRMAAMKKAAAEKKCAIDSEYSSRRSVY
jgi:hypothetical protein